MKKILVTAMLCCGVISGFAQSRDGIRLGVTGGMNVSNITDMNADCRIGFNAGLRAEVGIMNNFYFGTGFLVSQKGYKYDSEIKGISAEVKGNPLYLQIPLQLGYALDLGNTVGLFAETGPYLAFGVAGKHKVEGSGFGTNVESKVDFFGDDGLDAKVFDAGWAVRAGVEVSNFQIHLGYEYGFTKVFEDGGHNSNFNVGVSYFF